MCIRDSSLNTPKKKFGYITGQIIRNSYTAKDNYLTLSLGTEQGVSQDMGVVNEKGIVGIITHSGSNFSRVQSVLNSRSRINAKIKGSDFFGGLVWNGISPNKAQLIDVPNLAPISIGDTIVTGGMSIIFPDQLPIGTIENFELTEAQDDYLINVNLFNNMQNIGRVYVIQNQLKKDIESIENLSNE
ncbi:MAG: rod shape-determining protein MreC, partial [Flavobacteriia bacterium]|nr:rod shape-determining protein MreC [Flavobacteriia bacterium]